MPRAEFLFLLSLLAATPIAAQNERWYLPEKNENGKGFACSVGETSNTVNCEQTGFCLSLLESDIDYCCFDKCIHYPLLTQDNGGTVKCADAFCGPESDCVNDLCQLKLSNSTNQAMFKRLQVPFTPSPDRLTATASSPSSSATATVPTTPGEMASSTSPPPGNGGSGSIGIGAIAGIIAAAAVGLIAAVVIGICTCRRRRRKVGAGGGGGKYEGPSDDAFPGGRVEVHADSYHGPKPEYMELSSESGGGWGSKPGTPGGYGQQQQQQHHYQDQTPITPSYELHGNSGPGGGRVHEMAG